MDIPLAALLAVLASSTPAYTGPDASAAPSGRDCPLLSPQEISLRFSYGDGDRQSLRYYSITPRVAYDLPEAVPAIGGNPLRLAVEAGGSIIDGDRRSLEGEFAFSPLILDYRYDAGQALVPFVEGGEGIVLTTLDDLNIGGPFEFSSQVGAGVHLFFTHKDAVTLALRYRHISNLGFATDNSGLNTLFFTIGLSHFPDR